MGWPAGTADDPTVQLLTAQLDTIELRYAGPAERTMHRTRSWPDAHATPFWHRMEALQRDVATARRALQAAGLAAPPAKAGRSGSGSWWLATGVVVMLAAAGSIIVLKGYRIHNGS